MALIDAACVVYRVSPEEVPAVQLDEEVEEVPVINLDEG
jgi:hypothetical protein